MKRYQVGVVAVLLAIFAANFGTAQAGDARILAGGMSMSVPMKSLETLKFKTVVKQVYDFSCGSAALATLLTYHYDRPVGESKVFDAMWAVGDQANIRAKGFSLLDMKLYLQHAGLKADGFRVPLDKLKEVGVPAIALIVRKGYAHFVVLRGIAKDYVVIGDPALGAMTMSRDEFQKMWNGIAFIVHDDADTARGTFNLERDLPLSRRASLGTALRTSDLAMITMFLARANEVF